MSWKKNEFDEVTRVLEATLNEQPARGGLTRVASFDLAGLIQIFEERAKTAPESLPEAPWEKSVNGSFKCGCGQCDGAGLIYVEGKGVKFCDARSRRSGQSKGRSKELSGDESERDRLDLSAIFQEQG